MPTYDYKCDDCENIFEVFQKMKDEPLKTCPQCGGEVRRIVSGGTGVIYKGSGFYITDYKAKGSAQSKTESMPETKAESKAETVSSDSSTEIKTETPKTETVKSGEAN